MLRTLAAHGATAAVTLALALALMGGRRGGRPAPIAQVPGPRADTPTAPRPPARGESPTPATPPPLSADLLRRVDADEQVNIRVYAAVNRGVVNITSRAEEGPLGDEADVGSGSGFVIDRRGHILTNYHVVEGADALRVTLFDGSSHEARVVGRDPSNDVAVIRVDVPDDRLVPVPLGDSSRLAVGMKVLAVGNPFGLERTLTTGIVSSLDRSMKAKNGRTIRGIIQTDAAINPGNSGGPLLNTRGEVIGMTTAIISHVGQSAGIGFAVPINAIRRILGQLIEHGRVIRADLGLKRVFVLDGGLLVVEVAEGGPADRAGIRPIRVQVEQVGPFLRRRVDPDSADVIVALDGKPVRSVDDLLTAVEARAPGTVVTLTVVRDGRPRDVKVVLGRS